MSQALEPIVRSVRVRCSLERAFEVFTAEMHSWWPVATHSRSASEHEGEGIGVERVEFQGRVGGRILEHTSGGRVLPWAEIVGWEPPRRFVMAWKPHAREQPPTEVEVTFNPIEGGTEVVLVHSGWERLEGIQPDLERLYGSYAGGWTQTLSRFADAAQTRDG